MPVYKHRIRSGALRWGFMFSLPGSSRGDRRRISESGFATKSEAVDAETRRRIEEQKKRELAKAGGEVTQLPTTLSLLLEEFFRQHVDGRLAPKTVERYHEQAAYLDPALGALAITDVSPLLLSREWRRLVERGGRHRRTKAPRPLSSKTVQNIAGVLSSAFKRAIKWGLIAANPVPASEPPVPKKRRGMALTVAVQENLVGAATGPWCLGTCLDVSAGTGARRGEALAIRWSDIQDGRVLITRSLTQTRAGLEFKCTKTEDSARPVSLPQSSVEALEEHRKRQDVFRQRFGADYRFDLDLIFANPDGTPLRPDSVSAAVSALCRKAQAAQRREPAHPAPHPWIAFAGRRCPVAGGLRAIGAFLRPRDRRSLLARYSRTGRRGGATVGGFPSRKLAAKTGWRCTVSSAGALRVAARGSAKPVSL